MATKTKPKAKRPAKRKPTTTTTATPFVSTVKVFPTEPTTTLPDGTVLTKGDLVKVTGVAGVFRFQYVRNGEVTVYGGTGTGQTAYQSFRTFRPGQIGSKVANVAAAKLAATATAGLPADYDVMSPGQKAAYTKRMKAAGMVMGVAA